MLIKKIATKKPVSKTAEKPATKKVVEKKVAVKKVAEKKVIAKPAVKKPVAKKTVTKTPVEKKVTVKKVVEKKVIAKPAVKKPTAKTPVEKKVAIKKIETTKKSAPVTKTSTDKASTPTKKSATKKVAKLTKSETAKSSEIKVQICTNVGNIDVLLEPEKAPITVANFLRYISMKHYNGLIFHRVIPDFMIQAGAYDDAVQPRETSSAIRIESNNGLKNSRGSLAMARGQDPNSATSQFFINIRDNDFLDFKEATLEGYGYAVFGKVIKGMDVVDKIAAIPTEKYEFHDNVPIIPIIITTIKTI